MRYLIHLSVAKKVAEYIPTPQYSQYFTNEKIEKLTSSNTYANYALPHTLSVLRSWLNT